MRLKVHKALKEPKVRWVIQELKDLKVLRVIQVLKVLMGHWVVKVL